MILFSDAERKGYLVCIISISNNVLSDYELDDRVRSRIGSSEIFFEPYSKDEVLKILKERSSEAFSSKVNDGILEYCAKLSSQEHGDARRAIDLLRVTAEIASRKNEKISKEHVDLASEILHKDRVENVLSNASYHLKLACVSLARITFLSDIEWHPTSTLYKQYCKIMPKGEKPLTYRRVSELLTELENTGLVISQTSSKGRHGYGTQYKLVMSPEIAGMACFPEFWKGIVAKKIEHDAIQEQKKHRPRSKLRGFSNLAKTLDLTWQRNWKSYVRLK